METFGCDQSVLAYVTEDPLQIGVGGPVGELSEKMRQIMKANSEQLEQLLPR